MTAFQCLLPRLAVDLCSAIVFFNLSLEELKHDNEVDDKTDLNKAYAYRERVCCYNCTFAFYIVNPGELENHIGDP